MLIMRIPADNVDNTYRLGDLANFKEGQEVMGGGRKRIQSRKQPKDNLENNPRQSRKQRRQPKKLQTRRQGRKQRRIRTRRNRK